MNPISGVDQLIRTLQNNASSRTKIAKGVDKSKEVGAKHGDDAKEIVRSNTLDTEILDKIQQRLDALPKESRTEEEVTSIVVDSIFSWQLGEQYFQDPKFLKIARDVKKNLLKSYNMKDKLSAIFDF